jgi:hypothetical protein
MEYSQIFVVLFTALAGVISAVVNIKISRMSKKLDDRNHDQEDGFKLILEGLDYIGDLADATAEAVQTGTSDGKMKQARKNYSEFKKHYSDRAHEQLANMTRCGND